MNISPILKHLEEKDLKKAPPAIQLLHFAADHKKAVPPVILADAMIEHPQYFGDGPFEGGARLMPKKLDLSKFGRNHNERKKNFRKFVKETEQYAKNKIRMNAKRKKPIINSNTNTDESSNSGS